MAPMPACVVVLTYVDAPFTAAPREEDQGSVTLSIVGRLLPGQPGPVASQGGPF